MHSAPFHSPATPDLLNDVLLNMPEDTADAGTAHGSINSSINGRANGNANSGGARDATREAVWDHRTRSADRSPSTFLDMARWVDAHAQQCSAQEALSLGRQLQALRVNGSETVYVDMTLDPELSQGLDRFLSDGQTRGLPSALQQAMKDATGDATEPSCSGPGGSGGPSGSSISTRLMTLLAGLQTLSDRMDQRGSTRTLLNFGHTTVRSLGSVGLTTLARQAVGRAIDLALAQGTSELTRTLIGAGAMALPVMGQLMLMWRDEQQGEATAYSRATRLVLMSLSVGVGGLALATGTLTNPGLRLAEGILYPLLRDAAQAMFPMMSDPDSGPTKRSLAASGTAYAVNQLGVSRAFAAAPDVGGAGLLLPGLIVRSLANAAGESVDLMSLLYANHISRHGASTLPRLRIGRGDLAESLRTPLHWDTMAARGCFVQGFNQLYDTLLADRTLTRALASVVGPDHAFTAADWLTELTAAALTVATYPFWTDPVHARGYSVPRPAVKPPDLQQVKAMEEGSPVQYAGNHAEPAVATDRGPVTLLSYVEETGRASVTEL